MGASERGLPVEVIKSRRLIAESYELMATGRELIIVSQDLIAQSRELIPTREANGYMGDHRSRDLGEPG
ncbi:hypothetical protein [Amycolatopsis sp. lyj-84]|uniref:hypothetical protein n=1 Tax=Amycolatopsis sp. lyj-84 TaxID=2789284 RepID=UPI003979AF00